MLFKRSGRLTGVSQGFKEERLRARLREVSEKGTEGWSRGRGENPGKKESERWGLERQRERLTDLKEGGLNENI